MGKHAHLERLWKRFGGQCRWCGRTTRLLPPVEKRKVHPEDMATRDHIRSKWHPKRREPMRQREYRIALACRECNQARAYRDQLLFNLELLLAALRGAGPEEPERPTEGV